MGQLCFEVANPDLLKGKPRQCCQNPNVHVQGRCGDVISCLALPPTASRPLRALGPHWRSKSPVKRYYISGMPRDLGEQRSSDRACEDAANWSTSGSRTEKDSGARSYFTHLWPLTWAMNALSENA